MKPLIGITSTRHVIPATAAAAPPLLAEVCSDDYAQGVEAAGGIPIVIPFVDNLSTLDALTDRLDGLLLAGGEDVAPLYYGEAPAVGLGEVVPERDEIELRLIRRMVEKRKPIFGICRGLQILNVAFGGTLYQDLPREWPGHTQHRQRARRDFPSHTVRLEPGSRVSELFGGRTDIRSNSFHHQAVKRLGDGLQAVAWDSEGLIEAVEHREYPFVVAVQWHPENLWRQHREHLGLFEGFIRAAERSMVRA